MTVKDELYKETNGSFHREWQTTKFAELEDVINRGFNESHKVMREGFQLIASELRVTRDNGVVPVPLLDKILTSNNEAYKEILTSITISHQATQDSANATYKYLLKMILVMMVLVLCWVTGMRVWLPGTGVKIDTSNIEVPKE